MKKILLPMVIAAVISLSGCSGSNSETEAKPTVSPSSSAAANSADASGGAESASGGGSINIERVSNEEFETEVTDDSVSADRFIDTWHAVGTTSENSAFSAMELTIKEDGSYIVSISFDNDFGTTSYEGEYTVSDGVLEFDESFAGCSAYFFEDNPETLVVDNGSTLVFCEHLEQESEMIR